ncbi:MULTISPECIES: hypothetical protein [Lactobacillaceae]|uniref:Transposase n=1 Tax=Oenococcus alcoholitolerans TaxID=931074 RepID=A0ABR4XSV3_9LACO|nr:hypothetical protein [Limosilactobacillus reuteri]KGO32575.1 hypothetical protein Q757_00255 [Oenococcus alcoholitolerans]MDN6032128.1 hypothetical protein [Lactococcus lactis]MDN6081015.1 hypothetical protein [Leuconostoc sp.]MDU4240374.1 hypothetical protein [Limosilactobacillus fermentum]MCC4456881.1 hypothetical protein [Limosilactobacillus reuteri]
MDQSVNHAQPIRFPNGGTVSATQFKDLQKKYQEALEENKILKAAMVLLRKRWVGLKPFSLLINS